MPAAVFDLGRDAKLQDSQQALIRFWNLLSQQSAVMGPIMDETEATAITLQEMVESGAIARAEPADLAVVAAGIAQMLRAHVTVVREMLNEIAEFPAAIHDMEQIYREQIAQLQRDAAARRQ